MRNKFGGLRAVPKIFQAAGDAKRGRLTDSPFSATFSRFRAGVFAPVVGPVGGGALADG